MQISVQKIVSTLQQWTGQFFGFLGESVSWVIQQIGRLLQLPFSSLSIWKWMVVVVTVAAVVYFLYNAVRKLWDSLVGLLKAFANTVYLFILSLPWFLLTGIAIVIGLWLEGKVP